MTSVLLRLVRSTGGEGLVAELLDRAKIKHEPVYLENVDNWVSLDEACAMLEAGVQLTGDPSFARRVGEHTLRQHAGTQVATVLRSLGSTEAVLQAITQSAARLSAVTKMDAIEAEPGARALFAYTTPASITPYSVTLLCACAATANRLETVAANKIFFILNST